MIQGKALPRPMLRDSSVGDSGSAPSPGRMAILGPPQKPEVPPTPPLSQSAGPQSKLPSYNHGWHDDWVLYCPPLRLTSQSPGPAFQLKRKWAELEVELLPSQPHTLSGAYAGTGGGDRELWKGVLSALQKAISAFFAKSLLCCRESST